MKKCKAQEDGYCLREENDYCPPDTCKCPHTNQHTKTLKVTATCETTATFCLDCKKQLTTPKTNC